MVSELNKKKLLRKVNKKAFEVFTDSGEKVSLDYWTPGVYQYSLIFKMFIDSFLPDELSPDDVSKLSLDEKLKLSFENLSNLKGDVQESDKASAGMKMYTRLFLRDQNLSIVRDLVRQCFQLNAEELSDSVLLQLVALLIEDMSEKTAA